MDELSVPENDLKLVNVPSIQNDDADAVITNAKVVKNKVDWLRNDLVSLLDD